MEIVILLFKLLQEGEIKMDKKTVKLLAILAGVVAVAVIGYLIYMYGIMPASKM